MHAVTSVTARPLRWATRGLLCTPRAALLHTTLSPSACKDERFVAGESAGGRKPTPIVARDSLRSRDDAADNRQSGAGADGQRRRNFMDERGRVHVTGSRSTFTPRGDGYGDFAARNPKFNGQVQSDYAGRKNRAHSGPSSSAFEDRAATDVSEHQGFGDRRHVFGQARAPYEARKSNNSWRGNYGDRVPSGEQKRRPREWAVDGGSAGTRDSKAWWDRRGEDASDAHLCFVFGIGPVAAALQSKQRSFVRLYVEEQKMESATWERIEPLVKAAEDAGVPVERSSKMDFPSYLRDKGHQGIALEASPLSWPTLDALPSPRSNGERNELWVALDGITDPMNFGAILRSALLLGASGVITTARNTAPLSSIVSKASAGAMEVMPVHAARSLPKLLAKSRKAGWSIAAAEADETAQRTAAKRNRGIDRLAASSSCATTGDAAGTDSQPLPPPAAHLNIGDDATVATATSATTGKAAAVHAGEGSRAPGSVSDAGAPDEDGDVEEAMHPCECLTIDTFTGDRPTILVIGSEGSGIRTNVVNQCDRLVSIVSSPVAPATVGANSKAKGKKGSKANKQQSQTLVTTTNATSTDNGSLMPTPGAVDSLNVSVATALLLYKFHSTSRRQSALASAPSVVEEVVPGGMRSSTAASVAVEGAQGR